MMLIQLQHHNRKTDEHNFVGQREACPAKKMRAWVHNLQNQHPLPEGRDWEWLVCDEMYRLFFVTTAAQSMKS